MSEITFSPPESGNILQLSKTEMLRAIATESQLKMIDHPNPSRRWDPFELNGSALRLRNAMRMSLTENEDYISVMSFDGTIEVSVRFSSLQRAADVRKAIVYCAVATALEYGKK